MKKSRKTSTNFYKQKVSKKKQAKNMRMTFYKTDIKNVPQSGNFEFRVKGLPSIKKEPFKSNIIFATSSVNFKRKGQGPTLDKIFGSNFKRIKVPV